MHKLVTAIQYAEQLTTQSELSSRGLSPSLARDVASPIGPRLRAPTHTSVRAGTQVSQVEAQTPVRTRLLGADAVRAVAMLGVVVVHVSSWGPNAPLATLGSVLICLDRTLRTIGAVPTYALTDNERTVTMDRIAGVSVRHPAVVAFGRHYGLRIVTCVPADPESKGGSESTVRVAKADLVPTECNLLPAYDTFPR